MLVVAIETYRRSHLSMAGVNRQRGGAGDPVVEEVHGMDFVVFATRTSGIKGQGDVAPQIAIGLLALSAKGKGHSALLAELLDLVPIGLVGANVVGHRIFGPNDVIQVRRKIPRTTHEIRKRSSLQLD